MNGHFTVAIVEDNHWAGKMLEDYCAQCGLQVVFTASDGEALLDIFNEIKPDILLVDIGLRGYLNGISTVQSLRQAGHKQKVIMVSGTTNIDHILTSFHDLGSLYFLSKPVLFPKFQSAIARAVAEIEAERLAAAALEAGAGGSDGTTWITVKNQKSQIPVAEYSILYVEKEDKRHAMIYLTNGETIESGTNLTDILAQSSTYMFSPYKGFLVNMRYVISYVKESGFPASRRFLIHLQHTQVKIPLSRNLQKEFAKLLQELR